MYFHGPDLELIRPRSKVSKDAIFKLTHMENYDIEFLDTFHGHNCLYDHL